MVTEVEKEKDSLQLNGMLSFFCSYALVIEGLLFLLVQGDENSK